MKNYIDINFKEWAHSTPGTIKSMKGVFKQGDIIIEMSFNKNDLEMLKHSIEMAIDEIRLSEEKNKEK